MADSDALIPEQANTEPVEGNTEQVTPSVEQVPTQETKSEAVATETTEKPVEPAVEAKEEAKPEPTVYTDFSLPDGVTMNEDVLKGLEAFSSDKGLNQEEVQSIVNLGAILVKDIQTAEQASLDAKHKEWADATKSNTEFGGDKFAESAAVIIKALDAVDPDGKARELFEKSHVIDNPDVFGVLFKMSQAFVEDSIVKGGVRSRGEGFKSKNFYENTKHN